MHAQKTSEAMAGRIDYLQTQLGAVLFSKIFSLLLPDRGSEFEKIKLFEQGKDGETRLNMFFCDPMQSSQKPHVENNHNYVHLLGIQEIPRDSVVLRPSLIFAKSIK